MWEMFFRVLNMSITSSYVIVAVLLARAMLRKAPKKYSYMLWAAVAFRLAVPFSFESVFSLFNLKIPGIKNAQHSGGYITHVQVNTSAPSAGQSGAVPGDIAAGLPSAPDSFQSVAVQDNVHAVLSVIIAIWCIGACLMLAYGVYAYIKTKMLLDTAVFREENIFESDRIRSPFVLGFIKPRIYIPFGIDEQSLPYVLAHERFHLKRLDHIAKLFAFVLLSIHWFNPFCWLAFMLASRDMEMSCDEHVIANGAGANKAYSMMLLSVAANRRFPAPAPIAFGETSVKSRITNALRFKKPKRWVSLFAILLCIITVIACVPNPISAQEIGLFTGKYSGLYSGVEYVYKAENAGEYFAPEEAETVLFEVTPQNEFTFVYLDEANEEQAKLKRLGLMRSTELTEDNFDFYFEADAKHVAEKFRKENYVSYYVPGAGVFMLCQKNGDIYLLKMNIPGGGANILFVNRIGEARYTSCREAPMGGKMPDSHEFVWSYEDSVLPLKVQSHVEYDRIEAVCANGYFVTAEGKTRSLAFNVNEYLYWQPYNAVPKELEYFNGHVITIYFYKEGELVNAELLFYEAHNEAYGTVYLAYSHKFKAYTGSMGSNIVCEEFCCEGCLEYYEANKNK